jgi:hypothetical protein
LSAPADTTKTIALNSAKIDSTAGTVSFVILLSPKESLITLIGREFRGKGSSLATDRKVPVPPHPTLDSGTGGFMLILTECQNTAGPGQLLF